MLGAKLKILFFAEGATLAHVARPFVLANSLDPGRFEICFARPAAFAWLTADSPFRLLPLACQDASVFSRRLDRGLPLYGFPTLVRYVEDDLALIDAETPDLIVGDFRLSLSVSARLRHVPYATICDAYWSPEAALRPPLPVMSFTRHTPLPLAQGLFKLVSPLALRLHSIPIKRLRARFGLPSLGYDLRRCYTDADLRLFGNFPALFPDIRTSSQAAFVGPVAWSPARVAEPAQLESGSIYVTMGSSGDTRVLRNLLPALEDTGLPILLSSAGRPLPPNLEMRRTRVFDFLPGDLVCKHASLVVCNGGSPTTNQALANGVPVLGVVRNMDQFLNMRAVEQFGAGVLVRADRASGTRLHRALEQLLHDTRFATRARALAQTLDDVNPAQAFHTHLTQLLTRASRERRR
ncbi:glycosyltransferase [Aromatoleum sp.]|uniref:glycosyltransferase n=1 Tax=Aromatoleum sp. TaxID=2307007 RepID=UPI002FCA5B14